MMPRDRVALSHLRRWSGKAWLRSYLSTPEGGEGAIPVADLREEHCRLKEEAGKALREQLAGQAESRAKMAEQLEQREEGGEDDGRDQGAWHLLSGLWPGGMTGSHYRNWNARLCALTSSPWLMF